MRFLPRSPSRPFARRTAVPMVALAIALGTFACSDDSNAKPSDCTPIKDGKIEIDGQVSGWTPKCLSVPVGTDVHFTAKLLDDLPHDHEVSGPSLTKPKRTGDPVKGGQLSLEVLFDKAGYHQFVCTVHANMEGSIYVEK